MGFPAPHHFLAASSGTDDDLAGTALGDVQALGECHMVTVEVFKLLEFRQGLL